MAHVQTYIDRAQVQFLFACRCFHPGLVLEVVSNQRNARNVNTLTCLEMLDYSQLKTPANHGDVLVAPSATSWVPALRQNAASLSNVETVLCGVTLGEWRRQAREKIVGDAETPVIVTGHQPEFIHAGVWAKHVLAMRAAEAIDGAAVNLVVDCDAVKDTALAVPSMQANGIELRRVRFAAEPAGFAFEQLRPLDRDAIGHFENSVKAAMGDRFGASQMPVYFDAMRVVSSPKSWVDQAVTARRAIEQNFGVQVLDRRISEDWCNPIVVDMLLNACRFAESYNRALSKYRRDHRVRGAQRPIPDLQTTPDKCEVALWAFHPGGVRHRLFVERKDDWVRLFSDKEQFAEIACAEMDCCEGLALALNGWQLRPRALTLTIWARLLLADLFIHGIGGAKYDRISDAIIQDYYGVSPPSIACVSATMHLDLPRSGIVATDLQSLSRSLRDIRYNPQRHLSITDATRELFERRAALVKEAALLSAEDSRNKPARRDAFQAIRSVNARLFDIGASSHQSLEDRFRAANQALKQDGLACGREYFFGLMDRGRMEHLLDALPAKDDFVV